MIAARTRRPPAAQAALVVTVFLTMLAAVGSTEPVVIGAAGLCLVLVIALLWHGEDPPILFLPALFQWSEVALMPLSTVWRQVPFRDLGTYGVDLQGSALYGLAGVAALAIGLRLGSRRMKGGPLAERLRSDAARWRFREVALVAFSAMGGGYGFAAISSMAGPARELCLQLSNIKYAGLFALAYWCLARSSHIRVLAAVMVFEIVFGMTGFFADFKYSILTLLVAALAARPRVRISDVLAVGAATGLLLCVATFWSAVKPDYRNFVNKGTGAQAVLVSIEDRVAFLWGAATSIDSPRFADGFDRLVDRHGYIEYLGLTMQNVPYGIPHENGNLTIAVLEHITMPRFLFPWKPPLPSDTEVMAKYTGLTAAWNEHTSISIGYLGELYIDFGLIGGLIAACVMGWIVGCVYRYLRADAAAPALLTSGLCLMIALPIAYFGTAYVKLVGSFVFSSVIAIVVQRYGLPILLSFRRFRTVGHSPHMQAKSPRG